MARLAKSLVRLFHQVDIAYPNRSRASDGWIGDAAHAARRSDHNSNAAGVVQAIDITHDPANGFDSYAFAETLRRNQDPRIKYVISNGRIFNRKWTWKKYTDKNPHSKHVHVSVEDDPRLYDNNSPWALVAGRTPAPPPASDAFEDCVARVFVSEGGYTDDPNDSGGATNFGITIATYRKHVNPNATKDDIRKMSKDGAKTIYRQQYWEALLCHRLPFGVDYAVFDFGVHSGVDRSAIELQKAVGVNADGLIGARTLSAVYSQDPSHIINALCDARLEYMKTRPGWTHYQTNWTGRVAKVRAAALAMVRAPKRRTPTEYEVGAGAGGLAGGFAAWLGAHPAVVFLVVAAVATTVVLTMRHLRKRKET